MTIKKSNKKPKDQNFVLEELVIDIGTPELARVKRLGGPDKDGEILTNIGWRHISKIRYITPKEGDLVMVQGKVISTDDINHTAMVKLSKDNSIRQFESNVVTVISSDRGLDILKDLDEIKGKRETDLENKIEELEKIIEHFKKTNKEIPVLDKRKLLIKKQ